MIKVWEIHAAEKRIRPYIQTTPVLASSLLSTQMGSSVVLKMEQMQVGGSFKPRGAFNKILKYGAGPYVAPTAGGHGVGFAYAASVLGANAKIYLPESADPDKVRAMSRCGAELVRFSSMVAAREAALVAARDLGYHFVSAYNDREMIEGGGTLALELIEQVPDLERVVVPVGGGGLIGGMSVVLRAYRPDIQIVGVQQTNAPVLARWFEQRRPIAVPCLPSIAEGVGAQVEEDAITWPLVREGVDRFVLVSEAEIVTALRLLFEEEKVYVEPSAAVAVAALAHLPATTGKTVAVLTGRNIAADRFVELLGLARDSVPPNHDAPACR